MYFITFDIDRMIDWLIDWLIDFWCLAPLSNISAISWRPVLVVEEAGVPGENHRPMGKQLVNFKYNHLFPNPID